MIFDAQLIFCENKTATAAITSNVLDFKGDTPDVGANGHKMALIVVPTTAGTGTGTVTLTLEDSADNATFAAVESYGPLKATDFVKPLAFSLPLSHKRYLRLKTSVSGTVSTLTLTAFVGNDAHLGKLARIEGYTIHAIKDGNAV